MMRHSHWMASAWVLAVLALIGCSGRVSAAESDASAVDATKLFRLGEKLVIKGQTFYVAKKADGQMVLSPPQPPTASIGAFIVPVAAKASSWQERPVVPHRS